MKLNYLIFLCLIIGTLTTCQKSDVDREQNPQILQASVLDDPNTTVEINQVSGVITISPSAFELGRMRGNITTVNCQTTPNTFLGPVDGNFTESKNVSMDVVSYDNNKPTSLSARIQNPSQSLSKEYQLQLKAAGPVRFESIPALNDTKVISLKYYQTYLVELPVSNLYDGHPLDYRIYATLDGSRIPIELALGYDRSSQDYVQFYFDQKMAKPGVYTIELRKTDGQRAVSPTRIVVDNS